MNLEASLHSLLTFAWTLTRPLLRQNIVFSYSERIPVSFSWLFHYFSFFFCYFTLLLIFTKIILLSLFYYIYISFHKDYFYFSCSGMFRDVPECSGMFLDVPCSGFYRRPPFLEIYHSRINPTMNLFGNRHSGMEKAFCYLKKIISN